MKIQLKGHKQTSYGSKRTRNHFLFFPKIIDHELRWLEYAVWQEIFTKNAVTNENDISFDKWVAVSWFN